MNGTECERTFHDDACASGMLCYDGMCSCLKRFGLEGPECNQQTSDASWAWGCTCAVAAFYLGTMCYNLPHVVRCPKRFSLRIDFPSICIATACVAFITQLTFRLLQAYSASFGLERAPLQSVLGSLVIDTLEAFGSATGTLSLLLVVRKWFDIAAATKQGADANDFIRRSRRYMTAFAFVFFLASMVCVVLTCAISPAFVNGVFLLVFMAGLLLVYACLSGAWKLHRLHEGDASFFDERPPADAASRCVACSGCREMLRVLATPPQPAAPDERARPPSYADLFVPLVLVTAWRLFLAVSGLLVSSFVWFLIRLCDGPMQLDWLASTCIHASSAAGMCILGRYERSRRRNYRTLAKFAAQQGHGALGGASDRQGSHLSNLSSVASAPNLISSRTSAGGSVYGAEVQVSAI